VGFCDEELEGGGSSGVAATPISLPHPVPSWFQQSSKDDVALVSQFLYDAVYLPDGLPGVAEPEPDEEHHVEADEPHELAVVGRHPRLLHRITINYDERNTLNTLRKANYDE
jgi:hypothetical protein